MYEFIQKNWYYIIAIIVLCFVLIGGGIELRATRQYLSEAGNRVTELEGSLKRAGASVIKLEGQLGLVREDYRKIESEYSILKEQYRDLREYYNSIKTGNRKLQSSNERSLTLVAQGRAIITELRAKE